MKNFCSMRNVLNRPDTARQLKLPADDTADEDEAQVRTILHRFFLDNSFSMKACEENICNAILQSIP